MEGDVSADALNQLIADEYLSYDKIRVYLEKKYKPTDKKEIIENLYTNIGIKDDLTLVVPPIHYLFDKYISNIGNTSENINLLFDKFDLYKLFDIMPQNIFSVPVPLHATLFYKIIKTKILRMKVKKAPQKQGFFRKKIWGG